MKRPQIMIATLAIHILCISPLAVGAEQYPASGSAAAQGSSPQVIIQSIEPYKWPATSTEFRCRVAFQCLMFNGKAEWPGDCVAGNAELRAVLELVGSGHFARGDAEVFRPLVDNLTQSDPFLVLADYAAYVACQEKVRAAWQDAERWTRMSILNTARSGKFSSDRAIAEYCDEIWNVHPVTVKL